MLKRMFSLMLCFILVGSLSVIAFANKGEPDLTLDFNKRYTDISEYEDVNDPLINFGAEKEQKEERRNIYAAILVALLVVSIIVFIITIKRQPRVEDVLEEKKATKKLVKKETSLKDEEKSE